MIFIATKRQQVAWTLAKHRLLLMRMGWPERLHTRDFVGTLLADFVTFARLTSVALTDRKTHTTIIEERAADCAHRRVKERLERERS